MPLFTPHHRIKTFGGPEAMTFTTMFNNCGWTLVREGMNAASWITNKTSPTYVMEILESQWNETNKIETIKHFNWQNKRQCVVWECYHRWKQKIANIEILTFGSLYYRLYGRLNPIHITAKLLPHQQSFDSHAKAVNIQHIIHMYLSMYICIYIYVSIHKILCTMHNITNILSYT